MNEWVIEVDKLNKLHLLIGDCSQFSKQIEVVIKCEKLFEWVKEKKLNQDKEFSNFMDLGMEIAFLQEKTKSALQDFRVTIKIYKLLHKTDKNNFFHHIKDLDYKTLDQARNSLDILKKLHKEIISSTGGSMEERLNGIRKGTVSVNIEQNSNFI